MVFVNNRSKVLIDVQNKINELFDEFQRYRFSRTALSVMRSAHGAVLIAVVEHYWHDQHEHIFIFIVCLWDQKTGTIWRGQL